MCISSNDYQFYLQKIENITSSLSLIDDDIIKYYYLFNKFQNYESLKKIYLKCLSNLNDYGCLLLDEIYKNLSL